MTDLPDTLIDLLRRRVKDEGRRLAFTYLRDGEQDEIQWTYAELDRQARRVAGRLAKFAAGERALLVYPAGLEFLAAFFGCLYAGLVPVPACPPRPNQSLNSLQAIARDCSPAVALTTARLLAALRPRLDAGSALSEMTWHETDSLADAAPGWQPVAAQPDSLAYLQYTSGSTDAPRGVMLSHGTVLHNLRTIQDAFGHSARTVIVSWLPLFHDMGLVGMLESMYVGGRCVLFSPLHFLQNPLRWLRAIARYQGTTSGAPNFAYDLCVNCARPDRLTDLDLSRWQVASNASEPIRAETLERFTETFAPYGFRRETLYPCYGLAEATLFVTGGERTAAPVMRRFDPDGPMRVGCGWTWHGQRLLIVDPETRQECPAGCVGEIWVSGGNVAHGYWKRPEATRDTFQAHLANGDGPFLRTGDLGFLHDGQLFVTGRLKDVIIIRGTNYYPQDIEATVQAANAALRPACGAAFSVELGGEELLVVVQEVQREQRKSLDLTSILGDVRAAVVAEHGLRVHALVLLKTGSIPRTTSGKVRRLECRQQLAAGALEVWAADYGNPDCRGEK